MCSNNRFRLLQGQTSEKIIIELKNLIKELGHSIKDEPIGSPEEVFVYLEIERQSEASFWNNWEKSQTLKEIWNSKMRKEIGISQVEPCYELNKKWYLEQPIEVRGF